MAYLLDGEYGEENEPEPAGRVLGLNGKQLNVERCYVENHVADQALPICEHCFYERCKKHADYETTTASLLSACNECRRYHCDNCKLVLNDIDDHCRIVYSREIMQTLLYCLSYGTHGCEERVEVVNGELTLIPGCIELADECLNGRTPDENKELCHVMSLCMVELRCTPHSTDMDLCWMPRFGLFSGYIKVKNPLLA